MNSARVVTLWPAQLACPVDGLPLTIDGNARRCASGHTFDIAREGYCNLLLVQHKASLDPGDSKAMVAARHRVLEARHFAPLAKAVSACVLDLQATLSKSTAITILDAGCGEGYYLDYFASELSRQPDQDRKITLVGIDVSKWAIRQAARRAQPITWFVASNARPPFAAGSVDLILCLFGFPSWDGFAAIQAPGHHVMLVDPAPDHLIELREIIYPTVTRQPLAPLPPTAITNGYSLISEHVVRFKTQLPNPAAIQDLLAMTPHAHRITDDSRTRLAAHKTLNVTVDVVMRVAIKRA